MERITLVSLFRLPARLLTAAAGVTIAVTIILLLSALSEGVYTAAVQYPANNSADLYVGQRGATRLQSTSILPTHLENTIARIEGVREVAPITFNLIVMDIEGRKSPVYLYGYDMERRFGGAWKLVAGRSVRSAGEAVVDVSLASQHGLGMGSTIAILGHTFEIVGLSADTRSLLGAGVFLDINDARKVLGLPSVVSFYLVRIDQQDQADVVVDRISSALPVKVTTFNHDQAISETRDIAKQIMGGPLAMASMVAYLIGMALIGILRYNAVMGRIAEIAAMRAIGATAWQIFRYELLMESLLTLVAGAIAGVGLTMAAGYVVTAWIPHLQVVLNQSLLTQAVVATFVVGLLGSIWPMRRLSQIEPASAFRS